IFPIAGKYSFWMRGMNFPIDMVWIREGKVVGVTADVQPEPGKAVYQLASYPPPEPVDMVLEIKAGEAERTNVKAGDIVVVGSERVK
ncbi:MAG: DUF192 domain-containing protein, partial [Anaplasmataceae bacterium]|nr:DUF192 domain-containing protein [Anaplasmataceae bacterium]